MNSDYNVLYVETVMLAKRLGRSQAEVPLPFQLNELENYNAALKAEINATAAAAARADAFVEAAKAKAQKETSADPK